MKSLTDADAALWCLERGVAISPRNNPYYSLDPRFTFTLADRDGKFPGCEVVEDIHRLICDLNDDDGASPTGGLAWCREVAIMGRDREGPGVFLLEQMRRAAVGAVPFPKARAFSFEANEPDGFKAAAAVPMIFMWDVFLIPEGLDFFCYIDHHAVAAFVSRTSECHQRLLREFHHRRPLHDDWYFKHIL